MLISDLKLNPNNPRKSTEKQEVHLKKSLEKLALILIIALSIGSCKKDEFVMPECDCGEVSRVFSAYGGTVFVYQIRNYCTQNLKGFQYDHKLNYEKGDEMCQQGVIW